MDVNGKGRNKYIQKGRKKKKKKYEKKRNENIREIEQKKIDKKINLENE